MDEILAKASSQAMTFAIRSGISLASGFAIKKVGQLLDRIPPSEKARLQRTNTKLSRKTAILSTSIDLIKLSAARGNSALDSAVEMVSDLKEEIDTFETEIADILSRLNSSNEKDSVNAAERKIAGLLDSINDAIPLINLALITSGVDLSNAMDPRISPSRLLQASSHVTESNAKYEVSSRKSGSKANDSAQVGPVFDLKLYSVFYNPSRLKYVEDQRSGDSAGTHATGSNSAGSDATVSAVSWKEEFARASCKLERVPGKPYEYDLVITEDFDDGRYHDDDESAKVRRYKVHDIVKQFFSASGKLLRLEGSNSPVLTLKVNTPKGPEYVALGEVGTDFDDSSDEEDPEEDPDNDSEVGFEDAADVPRGEKFKHLSLLEYLIRLAALQENEQMSILDVKDEKLSLYLHDRTDKSLKPLSHDEKSKLQAKSDSQGHMLHVDSSVNRLKNLSLEDNHE
ncbi:hypothetical protein JCM33374_g1589 [Metschnikowia sp. JCM 33374]|nr:hypothetical protein JCM33374_g1589 [Metschnikowia sp. JCM 33374]